jgi:hypothetical protein
MVESIGWYGHEGTIELIEGIGREFETRRAIEIGGVRNEPQSTSQAIDADIFKYMANQLITEAGITPYLH